MEKKWKGIGIFLIAGLTVSAAGCWSAVAETAAGSSEKILQAVAVMHPTQGNNASGTVTFTRIPAGILIRADVEGLSPGKHGFHIHELGDCSGPDAKSAGGHYNPDGHPHAGPAERKRHMGDMGNIDVDNRGRGHYERVDDYLVLDGPKSIVGRAVIIHADADDLTSQPTGDAGARISCGVIGIAAAK